MISYEEFPSNVPELFQKLCKKEKYAYLGFGFEFTFNRTGLMPCPIIQAIDGVYRFSVGTQLQENSPYKRIFNKV